MTHRAFTRIGAVVLYSVDVRARLRCNEHIGRESEPEDRGDGPLHFECALAHMRVAILPAAHDGDAPHEHGSSATDLGWEVEDVEATDDTVCNEPYTIEETLDANPWGKCAVVCDTDGRSIGIVSS